MMSVDEETPVRTLGRAARNRGDFSDDDTTQDEDNDDDGAGDTINIPEDSFSMFYLANTCCQHGLPLIIYSMQMWILNCIWIDLGITKESQVSKYVQFLACFVSVFTSSDLIDGLLFFGRPIHDPDQQQGATGKKSLKWELSNLMRLSEGVFVVFVSFKFIAQSETVKDLFLNFVGVAFVSELDDGHYKLAAKGVLGRSAKEMAGRVTECAYVTKKKTRWKLLRYSCFAQIPIAMMGALILSFNTKTTGSRPVGGGLSLHLEHDGANACSACKEHSLKDYYDRGDKYQTPCVPFPREPLIFQGGVNGTSKIKLQLGLHLNKTHFSVWVSNQGTYFPKDYNKYETGDKCKLIFNTTERANELISFKRNDTLKEPTVLDFALLLDQSTGLHGKVVDAGDIDCFYKSNIEEKQCDGSENNTLSQVYNNLTRAWIVFDLKVMAEFAG